jgi:hypothetical protein
MADTAVQPLPPGHRYTAEDLAWWASYALTHPKVDAEHAAEAIEALHRAEKLAGV